MADRPILFSASMVRAILSGHKLQTRRIIKKTVALDAIAVFGPTFLSLPGNSDLIKHNVGDRLWVRETWRQEHPIAIQDGRFSKPGVAGIPGPPKVQYRVIYRADGEPLQAWRNKGEHPYFTLFGPSDEISARYPSVCSTYDRLDGKGVCWNSSIFMPRWASRLTLTVTDVRVERLQDISAEDAIAEGLSAITKDGKTVKYGIPDRDGLPGTDDIGWPWADWREDPRRAYAHLWDRINGKGAWATNPWVAAYSFTIAVNNIDQLEANNGR